MVRTIENLYQFHTRTESSTGIDSSPISTGSMPTIRYDSQRARELLVDTNYGDSLFIRFTDTRDNTELYSLGSRIQNLHRQEPGTALP